MAKKFVEDWVIMIVKDFIEQNWSSFESYCEDFKVNAEEISKELEGE